LSPESANQSAARRHPYAIRVTLLSLSELKDFFNGRNVVMYFDEGRVSNQPHYKDAETCNQTTPPSQQAKPSPSCAVNNQCQGVKDWKTANMLDSANNKLQELMQLLYLLSRDPAVPNEARYHVTVAQGEIALLAHVMRNTAEEAGEAVPTVENKTYPAAHP
jgi:hypothetical protein